MKKRVKFSVAFAMVMLIFSLKICINISWRLQKMCILRLRSVFLRVRFIGSKKLGQHNFIIRSFTYTPSSIGLRGQRQQKQSKWRTHKVGRHFPRLPSTDASLANLFNFPPRITQSYSTKTSVTPTLTIRTNCESAVLWTSKSAPASSRDFLQRAERR